MPRSPDVMVGEAAPAAIVVVVVCSSAAILAARAATLRSVAVWLAMADARSLVFSCWDCVNCAGCACTRAEDGRGQAG